MRTLEIFSGAGGLAKGLELAGFKHGSFVEFNKHACESLRANFEPSKVYSGDIRSYDFTALSDVSVVAGGPPCQPFSLGGKHKAYDDSRDMFPYAIKAIEQLKPKAFIFENVKGLLRESFAEYFNYILLRLSHPDVKNEGGDWRKHAEQLQKIHASYYSGPMYEVEYKLLNAADYGVPQVRERVVIIGIRSDLGIHCSFPQQTHSLERLLWEQHVSNEYWARHKISHIGDVNDTKEVGAIVAGLRGRFGMFPPQELPWQTIRDALKGVPDPRSAHSIRDHIFKDGARTYTGHTGSFIDLPSKTIKAGGHGVPGGENMIRYADGSVRYLTVYEAKLIQTFPKEFIIEGAWGEAMRQIGNAVPVVLAERIGIHLRQLLHSESESRSKAFEVRAASA